MTLKNRFLDKVREAIAANSELIIDDRCPTIESYRRTCGIIYGLKMSMELLEDAISESEEKKETETIIL